MKRHWWITICIGFGIGMIITAVAILRTESRSSVEVVDWESSLNSLPTKDGCPERNILSWDEIDQRWECFLWPDSLTAIDKETGEEIKDMQWKASADHRAAARLVDERFFWGGAEE